MPKKAENKEIREKQRKECKRKQDQLDKMQNKVPPGFKVYKEAKVCRLTSLASSLNAAVRDITPGNEIPAALGAPHEELQMYEEQSPN